VTKVAPEFIVVEGPIGVGKTTLARRLAETMNSELLLESGSENPFLPRFYEDPRAAALPTQLHFLFQRVRQIETLRQTDMFRPALIADFLVQKDRLFAQVTLNDDELDLYYQVYNRLTIEAPSPDLVIYLQASVDTLLRRVHGRGIGYEKKISEEYLRSVSEAYVRFFYNYDQSPLLIVNTHDFNLTDNDRNYRILLEYIQDLSPGRHYFNPAEL